MTISKTNPFWKACVLSIIALPLLADSQFDQDYQQGDICSMYVQGCCPELDSRLQIGGNYTRVTLQPKGHQSFNGNLGGMQAIYEFRPINWIYGAARFDWREGTTHGSGGERSILYFDAHERLGYTFAYASGRLTLFSGFGYHYLRQELKPKEGDSIRFTYNEFYVPLGLLAGYDVSCWFSGGVDFTWMPQVFPTVSIAPLKGSHWTLKNRINNFYVALPLTFTLTSNGRFQIILNPFYEYWQDGRTTAKTSSGVPLGLPGNSYNFYGVDLNFAYSF